MVINGRIFMFMGYRYQSLPSITNILKRLIFVYYTGRKSFRPNRKSGTGSPLAVLDTSHSLQRGLRWYAGLDVPLPKRSI